MKTPSPLLGFNNNVRHKGRVFHIQTEDSGVRHPHVITHLFADGGRILKTAKTSYAEYVDAANMAELVKQMMQDQHKNMLISLRDGQFDHLVDELLGRSGVPQARPSAPTTPSMGAAAASNDRPPASQVRPAPVEPPPEVAPLSAAAIAQTPSPPPARPAPAPVAQTPSPPPVRPAPAPVAQTPSPPPARPAQPSPQSLPPPPRGGASAPPPPAAAQRPSPIAPTLPAMAVKIPPPPPNVPVIESPPAAAASAAPAEPRPEKPNAAAGPSSRSSLSGPAGGVVYRPTPMRVPAARPRLDIDPSAIHRVPAAPAPGGATLSSIEGPAIDLGTLERAAEESETPFFQQIRDLPPPPAAVLGSRTPPGGAGGYSSVAGPQPSPASPPSARGRYAASRPSSIFATVRPQEGASIFGEDLISEKSLDEVILSYLAEDLDGPGEKK